MIGYSNAGVCRNVDLFGNALLSPSIREEENEEGQDPWAVLSGRSAGSSNSALDDEPMTPVGEADGMMVRLNVGSANGSEVDVASRGRGRQPRSGRLAMGYRADCEKCRQRVPGHYSHIDWE